MMQPADNRHLNHPADLRRLNLSRRRRVLTEREMRAAIVIVIDVRSQDTPQRSLVEDDHMVQALTANGTDQSLRVRILPWAPRRGLDCLDAHRCHAVPEGFSIDSVPIAQQEPGSGVPGKRLPNLLRRPLRRRMGGDRKYARIAKRVGGELVRSQAEDGSWRLFDGYEIDMTAEMLVWLDEIQQAVGSGERN